MSAINLLVTIFIGNNSIFSKVDVNLGVVSHSHPLTNFSTFSQSAVWHLRIPLLKLSTLLLHPTMGLWVMHF
jgi:hypothetical protein